MNEFPAVKLRIQDINNFFDLAMQSSFTFTGLNRKNKIVKSPEYLEGVYMLTASLILNSYLISKDSINIIERYRTIAYNIFKQFRVNHSELIYKEDTSIHHMHIW